MMTHYQLTCIKSWTSFRPGSEETVYGRYATIEQANVAICRVKEFLGGGVHDEWTGGVLKDGRLWYNCVDWGHEEYYKLRIRKQTVSQPNPSLAHYISADDDGDPCIVQELDASDQFRLLLDDADAREEIIDRVDSELSVEHQFQLLLENDNAREEMTDRIASELTVDDQFQLALEDEIARNEIFLRIKLEHSRRHTRSGGPTFEDVAFEKILNAEGGTERILDYLRQSTTKNNQQFEELVLGKIMQADDRVGEILENITSRKVTALSNQLRAELTRDIRRELEVKIREEIRLKMTSEDEGDSVAIKAENPDELANSDGTRRRKRARRAY
ncbi:hypothetical protein F4680DRAFT_421224 [Xylaria scruposa]|nr:hypothetical protein F4680DRAFT_421224 [Xylaria scruposa]